MIKKELQQQSRVLSALSDSCRLFMVKSLQENSSLCVSELAKLCQISISAASQHLKILELSGILHKNKKGQKICFSLEKEDLFIKKVLKVLS